MRAILSLWAVRRRAGRHWVMGLALAMGVAIGLSAMSGSAALASDGQAQQPQPQQPPQPQAPQQPPAPQPPPPQPQPQQPQPQQPRPQQPPGRILAAEAGILFNPIKPDRTADFEMVMGRLKEALVKSEDPTRKQQAAGWKVFRATEPGPNGSVLYLMIMDPAVQGADYSVSMILAEAFPTEVQDLYQKFSEAYAGGQSMVNLTLVQNLGQ